MKSEVIFLAFDIKVGSITNAQKVKKELLSSGYKANFHRLEKPQPGDGCGYAVVVRGDKDEILQIINSIGVRVLGVAEI